MNPYLQISCILALATTMAFLMQRLRLPLLLGHIITGILVGPVAFQIINGKESIEIFSQLGITALLFVIGLSLNPAVIREVGKVALMTGMGQIIFTTISGFLISTLFGYSWITSLFLAIALTFSSTIIVMKLLSDRGDEGKLYGKISIGFLLVQDLVATLILILVSTFNHDASFGNALLLTGAKALVLIGGLTFVGRQILPRISHVFSQSQEFLFLFSIGWSVGIAALFQQLGLSVEIGALAAGVTLASSPYRFEITAKMRLLRDFFIIMFFVLLGARLTWNNIGAQLPVALLFSVFVLIGKTLIMMAIMGRMRYSKKTSFFAGLTVAQVSEFSLILILLAAEKGYISNDIVSLVTMIGIITITVSTLMLLKADQLFALVLPYLHIFERPHPIGEKARTERYDAIIFGCNRVGNEFILPLKKKMLSYLVVDFDPAVIERLKARGVPCRYGDAHDNEFLDGLRLNSCKMIVSTIPDSEISMLLIKKQKRAGSKGIVIVSANTPEQAAALYAADASYVILPHYLGGNHTAQLVETYGTQKAKFDIERKHHLKYLEKRSV